MSTYELDYATIYVTPHILYHFDQFGQSLGFLILREIPENLKIFETFESGVRKNRVGQGTAELNKMVQYIIPLLLSRSPHFACICLFHFLFNVVAFVFHSPWRSNFCLAHS